MTRSENPWRGAGDRLLALLPGGLLVYLGFRSGGFFPGTVGFVALVLVLVLLVRTLLAERPFAGYGGLAIISAVTLALFAAWTLLSGQWSHAPSRALLEFDRALLYLLAVLCFGAAAGATWRRAWMVRSVAAGAFVVCASGLITRVLPNVWSVAANIANQRLSYPVSYWNVLGLLAALGILACLHLTSSERESPLTKVLGAAAVPVLALTLYFTFSRGGIVAAGLGLVIYVVLGASRVMVSGFIAALPPAAIALKSAYGANLLATADPTGTPAAVAQGHHVALVLGVTCLLAGGLRLALLALDRETAHWHLPAHLRRPVFTSLAGAGAVIVLVVVVALNAPHAVAREYDRFVNGTNIQNYTDLRQRLTDPGNNLRLYHWRVAWHGFESQPFHGQGAGTYALLWAQKRPITFKVLNAHSLYLEVLDELGVVGMVLLGVTLILMLAAAGRALRGPNRTLFAAIIAIFCAWLLHAGVDWDWQMPVVTLPVLALGAAALSRAPRRVQTHPDGAARGLCGRLGGPASLTRVGLGVGILALGVVPALVQLSHDRLISSLRAIDSGDCSAAIVDARSSLSVIGSRPEPWEAIGYCQALQGNRVAAPDSLNRAVQRDPGSWEPRYDRALVLAATGGDPRPDLQAALARDPREPIIQSASGAFAAARPRAWRSTAARFEVVILGVRHAPVTSPSA